MSAVPDPEELSLEDGSTQSTNAEAVYEAMDEPVEMEVTDNTEATPAETPKRRNNKTEKELTPSQSCHHFKHRVLTPAVDVEKIVQNYDGYALINRLEVLIDCCPPLEGEAFAALVTYLKDSTMNTAKYAATYAKAEKKGRGDLPPIDNAWLETMNQRSTTKTDVLNADFKKQKDEGVKESTRRAMEDLFAHYVNTGQLLEAMKLYNRGMREYCSQMKHVVQMWLVWIETAIGFGDWTRVEPLVSQAERSLVEADEAETVAAGSSAVASRAAQSVAQNAVKTNRLTINTAKTKVSAVGALIHLFHNKVKNATDSFLKVDADFLDHKWVMTVGDIARYGSICALASYNRDEIKKKCIGGDQLFRKCLEAEPKLTDMLSDFTRSQFGRCFDYLDSIKDQLLLDPFVGNHVQSLFRLIRKRALSQYLQPFAVADLNLMADLFRTNVHSLCDELIDLLDGGELEGRIDEKRLVFENIPIDERERVHAKAIRECETMLSRAEYMILRAIIQQGRICVTGDAFTGHGIPSLNSRGKRRGGHNDDETGMPLMRGVKSHVMRMLRPSQQHQVVPPTTHDVDSSELHEPEPDL